MNWRTVICCGMQRSASTWQYETARVLLQSRFSEAVALGYVTADEFQTRDTGGIQILKCHAGDERWARMLRDGEAIAIGSFRDLREACYSMCRYHGWNPRDDRQIDRAIHYLVYESVFWERQPNTLIQRYESLVASPRSHVAEIAARLGIDLGSPIVEKVTRLHEWAKFKQLYGHHLLDGRVAYDAWSPGEYEALTRRCSVWLQRHGYLQSIEPGALYQMTPDVFEVTCRNSVTVGRIASDPRHHYAKASDLPVHILGGSIVMFCDKHDADLRQCVSNDGFWESAVTLAIGRRLCQQPDSRLLNLGANCGYYALLAASLGCTVEAVDPQPAMVRRIRAAALANGFPWLRARANAITGMSGEQIELAFPEPNATLRVSHNVTASHDRFWSETITVDDLTREWDRVDMIIADIEGSEQWAWYGMLKTIRRNPDLVVVLEVNTARYDQPRELIESISRTYPLKHIAHHGAIEPITVEDVLDTDGDVMLWLERDRADSESE